MKILEEGVQHHADLGALARIDLTIRHCRPHCSGQIAAALALGFLVPAMFFLGAIFAALWATADLMGRRIEEERGAAWAAYDASHPAAPGAPGAPSED